ncbi:MAG: NAD+ synthase [Methanobacteriota archaeon]|nr:MAG: NAD+ synthase [Euryarchaeota archaeon]
MVDLVPRFRPEQIAIVSSFILGSVRATGRAGVVLGLSGGVDSALVAKLCADALGPDRVSALALPDGDGGKDLEDARHVAKDLGIEFRVVDISKIVGAMERGLKAFRPNPVALGNLRARARMVVLYYVANAENRVVMGTGNKSEIAVAYFTKWGDGGADFHPIGDLYKTQVREMARHLGLPETIVEKTPTAGLWPGQTDEGEIGVSYDELDRILLGIELQMPTDAIAEKTGLPMERVRHVEALVAAGIHKRKMPLIPKVGIRTFGLDWRE